MKTIELSNHLETLVDDDDYDKFSSFKWGIVSNRTHKYVARGTRKKGMKYTKILLHREIMNAPSDMMVDHINGNTLDNRKENLRLTTRAGNLRNSKQRADSKTNFKGVSRKVSKVGTIRFVARIQIDVNRRLFLGYFKTEQEAAEAYNKAALTYFGEFAKINVIPGEK